MRSDFKEPAAAERGYRALSELPLLAGLDAQVHREVQQWGEVAVSELPKAVDGVFDRLANELQAISAGMPGAPQCAARVALGLMMLVELVRQNRAALGRVADIPQSVSHRMADMWGLEIASEHLLLEIISDLSQGADRNRASAVEVMAELKSAWMGLEAGLFDGMRALVEGGISDPSPAFLMGALEAVKGAVGVNIMQDLRAALRSTATQGS